jgi:hypothetical protein
MSSQSHKGASKYSKTVRLVRGIANGLRIFPFTLRAKNIDAFYDCSTWVDRIKAYLKFDAQTLILMCLIALARHCLCCSPLMLNVKIFYWGWLMLDKLFDCPPGCPCGGIALITTHWG